MIRTYYLLTKPGIIMGNLITTAAGFALASRGDFNWILFLEVCFGLGLVIGSACVFNNFIDREIDKKMARTQNRALAKGLISTKKALLFASFLGMGGLFSLWMMTNLLAVSIAALGFFIYVALYSLWKTRTSYATAVGSISGALPPVIGYCAVSNQLDAGALLLFLILVLWQMPHFFAIAMYRFDDYSAASIPILPVKKGNHATKIRMLLYVIAFAISTVLLMVFGFTGYFYLIIACAASLAWLRLSIQGFKAENDRLWARQMFRLSLVIITALSIVMALDVSAPAQIIASGV